MANDTRPSGSGGVTAACHSRSVFQQLVIGEGTFFFFGLARLGIANRLRMTRSRTLSSAPPITITLPSGTESSASLNVGSRLQDAPSRRARGPAGALPGGRRRACENSGDERSSTAILPRDRPRPPPAGWQAFGQAIGPASSSASTTGDGSPRS